MLGRVVWSLGLVMVLAVSCGGRAQHGSDEPDATVPPGFGGFGGANMLDATPDAASDSNVGPVEDVVSDYVDPGCPDSEAPEPIFNCNPLSANTGCPEGTACYPYTDYPLGAGCGVEQHRADCFPPGDGQHGDRCSGDYGACRGGLICVVGAQSSPRCVPLCDPQGPATCSGGLLCLPVDVEGIGACG